MDTIRMDESAWIHGSKDERLRLRPGWPVPVNLEMKTQSPSQSMTITMSMSLSMAKLSGCGVG